jgi:uncharacterized protein YcgI (DUF1989 family)
LRREYVIQAGSSQVIEVKLGEEVTIIDLEGNQAADFFAVCQRDIGEYLSTGATMDCNESFKLREGDTIYSNLYQSMFEILEDDVEEHDLLCPFARPERYDFYYGSGQVHKEFYEQLDIQFKERGIHFFSYLQPIHFFMNTTIEADGSFHERRACSKAGDKIVLSVHRDTIMGIAVCFTNREGTNEESGTSIKVVVE